MAATISKEIIRWTQHGVREDAPKLIMIAEVTLDSSYAADGEAIDFVTNGHFASVDSVNIINADVGNSAGYVVTFDTSADKIVVFRQLDPADTGGADVALPEVAAAVDLSAITVTMLVVGVAA